MCVHRSDECLARRPALIQWAEGRSFVNAFRPQTFEVRLELFDLIFEALAMRSVLRCVDGPVLESRVLGAQRFDFPTKPAVFRLDIFPCRHVPIVARRRPCRTTQNLVEPRRTL
jgi:hypothetical protein